MIANSSASAAFILDFLRDLRAHNDRLWFGRNRDRYETARDGFEFIVSSLIIGFSGAVDLAGVEPGDCMYRLYRDLRFTKDKTPYKTYFSAVIGPGGRKSEGQGYYIQLEPDGGSLIAGGPWAPSAKELAAIRQKILRSGSGLKDILSSASYRKYFGGVIEGESLKTAPRGFPKDHPDIELIKRTQFMAFHHLSDAEVCAPTLIPHTIEVFTAMKPFIDWFSGTRPDPVRDTWPGYRDGSDDEDVLNYPG